MKKKYHLKTSCPQCGCSFLSVLTPEEIKEKYGDMPNVEMECSECMHKYHNSMKAVCPEWDKDCKLAD